MNAIFSKPLLLICLIVVILCGTFFRIKSYEAMKGVGVDEKYYSRYVDQICGIGPLGYPEIVDHYIERQKTEPYAFLPPTRVTFLLSASAWRTVFGISSLESVRAISTAASILLLCGGAMFAWRIGGASFSLAVTTLMAAAPTQLYIAHRALIDGFFATIAFFAIWTLWETLQKPKSKPWLIGYGAALALMVMTKENAAFVYLAILGILAANHWLRLGQITKPLIIATLVGPLIGVGFLALCAGGTDPLFTAYLLNVKKSYDLPYAITTGDGPWFRYVSDMISISPAITLVGVGGAFLSVVNYKTSGTKVMLYFIGFILLSYAIMGNLRYGMNLRYSLIWDFPLRCLAVTAVFFLVKTTQSLTRRSLIGFAIFALLVYSEVTNYSRIFIDNVVYDPVPAHLMHALKMIK